MTDDEFDGALIGGAFLLAARSGWSAVSVAAAAREAGLALERARLRFPGRSAILLRFGRHADTLALTGALDSGPVRERLFDVVMRRFDALQQHRAGVLALLRDLPADPADATLLALATTGSMGWMLEAAGVRAKGLRGALATQGLVSVWLYTLRAWQRDDTADLSSTMAALDRALSRVEQAAAWLTSRPAGRTPEPKPFPDPEADLADVEAASLAGAVSGAAGMPPPDAGLI